LNKKVATPGLENRD